MKVLIAVTCAVAAFSMASCGSGDPGLPICEQAAAVIDACGFDGSSLRTNSCTGHNQTYSKCAVDNKAAVCAGLSNPTNQTNAFNACIASLGGA